MKKTITVQGREFVLPNTRTSKADLVELAEALKISTDGVRGILFNRIGEKIAELQKEYASATVEEIKHDNTASEEVTVEDVLEDVTDEEVTEILEIEEKKVAKKETKKELSKRQEKADLIEAYRMDPKVQSIISATDTNKSDKIRLLLAGGMERRFIAAITGFRYQMIYQVEQRWLESQVNEGGEK